MQNNYRFNDKTVNIGAYYLAPYARTDAHIKDAAACGIDFFVNIPNDAELLACLHKYHIKAIVTGIFPSWFGGDGSNAGKMANLNPLYKYQEALDNFFDAPNILGIDTGDEPSSLDFTHYEQIFSYTTHMYPHLLPYLNIYPSYGVKGSNSKKEIYAQLRSDNYADYIESYCKKVTSDYICFDYYPYSASLTEFYHSLKTVSDACQKYKRKFFTVLQVNSHEPNVWISANQLRFQAFTAIAFGAQTIIWACYTAGWWYNHVLDAKGNKTEQYHKLQKVNSEIHFLGTEYIKYNYRETYFIGKHPISDLPVKKSLSANFFRGLMAENDEALLVSIMESTISNALFLCAAGDYYDKHPDAFSISFCAPNCKVTLLKNEKRQTLSPDAQNFYSFQMLPNEGALLIFLPY